MKRRFLKGLFRLAVGVLLITGLLLLIVLQPALTYANRTAHAHFTVYHQHRLDSAVRTRLNAADSCLKSSSLYRPGLHADICLNDGSRYPALLRTLRGPAFAWGFYDKVVLQGRADFNANTVELNGYTWNLTQLLAHELVHCLQFDHFGLLRSNPLGRVAVWKWEGYAEYVARQLPAQRDLRRNLDRLLAANRTDAASWGITLDDSTVSPRDYYNDWTLVQYCLTIERMTYDQLVADTVSEATWRQRMLRWYALPSTAAPIPASAW